MTLTPDARSLNVSGLLPHERERTAERWDEKSEMSDETTANLTLDEILASSPAPGESRSGLGGDTIDPAYGAGMRRVKLLTKQEEVELAQTIERGSTKHPSGRIVRDDDAQHAFEHMVEANLRLAMSIARKWQGRGVPLPDLVQEANLGLMHAVTKFDWRKGFKFSTYATWWITQYVSRSIQNHARTIRLPVSRLEQLSSLRQVRRELEAHLGREATAQELADALEIDRAALDDLLSDERPAVSLDMPLGENAETSLADLIPDLGPTPETETVRKLLGEAAREILDELPARERLVLELRFGLGDEEPKTLQAIGDRLGVTRTAVRQIEHRAMKRIGRSEALEETLSAQADAEPVAAA